MGKNTGIAAFLYRLLYAGIFTALVFICLSDFMGISSVSWGHIAVLMIPAVVFSAVRLLNTRQKVYAAILGIAVLVFLILSAGSERCLIYFAKVLELPFAGGEISGEEEIYIELGRVFLLALLCYPVQYFIGKNIYLKILSADMIGGWMLYMVKVPKSGAVLFILYVGLIAAEWARLRQRKMKSRSAQAYILGILPFLIIYIVLLCFMPMQAKPYDWQWAKDIYRSAEEKITMYAENFGNKGDEYFDGTTSGFSGDGGLFSDILQDNRQLMTLGIGKEKEMPVYLTGRVFDSFDGREWKSVGEDLSGSRNESRDDISESERALDVIETMYALESYAGSDARNYYKNISMDVSYQYFHTNYLLAPSKTWNIKDREKKTKYHLDNADIVFDRKAGYGTEYALRFCQLNMDRGELHRFLNSYTIGDAETWTNIARQYTGKSIPFEERYDYWDSVEERYLPETNISPDVEEWLAFITADAATGVEALQYIEIALSGMAYNTSPGELPETVTDEESFLDYFLLEKREGYCAYYATAFVLLARAEGYPARYVQGFCVPAVSGDETPVYSNMAHAWPEVYIWGKGWIPFEPTPGFGVNRYTVWEEDADGNVWSSHTGNTGSHTQEEVSLSEGGIVDAGTQEEERNSRFLPYLIRVAVVLLIGIILVFIVDLLWEKHRERGRKISDKYRLAVLHNLQILGMLRYRREPAETYHELTERIRQEELRVNVNTGMEEDNGQDRNEIPCGFIETFERYLYGTLEIDEHILSEVLDERMQLLEILKKRRRKSYLLCRIRLYVMRYR